MKLNWDCLLPEDFQERWRHFYLGLKVLERLTVPRKMFNETMSSISIHGFCDASQLAYGACVYLRVINTQGLCYSQLYSSKSRVAPIGQTTIPRLELCGAVLLSNLVNDVYSELQKLNISLSTNHFTYWTDSSIVLAWINCCQPLKPYVANRVAQILDISNVDQWRHVPSTSNPADIISRGIPAESLIDCSMWWHGHS